MDEIQEGITASVRALSAWKGDTQLELGRVLGLSKVTVAQRLGGRLTWTLKDVDALCKHYGVTFDQLTKGPAYWLKATSEGGNTPPYVPEFSLMAA